MGDAPEHLLLALSNSPPSLLKLMTEAGAAADLGTPVAAAGLLALRQVGVSEALRSALHMVGDTATPLSSEHKNRLAERFLQQRIVVDEHTAAAVLFESFSQSRISIVRDFPGAAPLAFPTVTDLLGSPPVGDGVAYSYNDRRSRVHNIFFSGISDSPRVALARAWWRNVNRLPDAGKPADPSAGSQWNIVSRRGISTLAGRCAHPWLRCARGAAAAGCAGTVSRRCDRRVFATAERAQIWMSESRFVLEATKSEPSGRGERVQRLRERDAKPSTASVADELGKG